MAWKLRWGGQSRSAAIQLQLLPGGACRIILAPVLLRITSGSIDGTLPGRGGDAGSAGSDVGDDRLRRAANGPGRGSGTGPGEVVSRPGPDSQGLLEQTRSCREPPHRRAAEHFSPVGSTTDRHLASTSTGTTDDGDPDCPADLEPRQDRVGSTPGRTVQDPAGQSVRRGALQLCATGAGSRSRGAAIRGRSG